MEHGFKLKVAELFAGVGGFRLGLEGWKGKSSSSFYKNDFNSNYEVIWSNQWEPSTKNQHASEIYATRFGNNHHSNEDIAKIKTDDIPDHDVLVGGFPCQDYSVARQLNQSAGIHGKKGVLWWQIHRILEEKGSRKPNYLILENVDRLLISPANQRGRDFAIILASLSDLGYDVEWRVVNAADYGMPQRRRRTFIIGFRQDSPIGRQVVDPNRWLLENSLFDTAFPAAFEGTVDLFPSRIEGDLAQITETFNRTTPSSTTFRKAGFMHDRNYSTNDYSPIYEGKRTHLADILQNIDDVPEEFLLMEDEIPKWQYLKGAKKEPRVKSNGDTFFYTEGPLPFPDPLDRPARTIITSEGGRTPSRFKHVIEQGGRLRRLTPIELERADMFPDEHTEGSTPARRAFFMGNALVVGVIERIGEALFNRHITASLK